MRTQAELALAEVSPGPAAAPVVKRKRQPALDVARGFLMTMMISNHTLSNVNPVHAPQWFREILGFLLTGTVGFSSISGMIVGYFLVVKRKDLDRIFARYRTQAFRLLLVSHLLISIALFTKTSGISFLHYYSHDFFITDTLAILFIFVIPRMRNMAMKQRLFVGVASLFLARVGAQIPLENTPLLLLREIFCGINYSNGSHILIGNYPVMALAGMFLIGSAVGEAYGHAENANRLKEFSNTLLKWAAGYIALAVTGVAIWAGLKLHVGGLNFPVIQSFQYPDFYWTLYPVLAAIAFCILAILLRRNKYGKVEAFFVTFGKTSLFTYVCHYFMVQAFPAVMGWTGTLTYPQVFLMLAVTLAILNPAARLWNERVKKS